MSLPKGLLDTLGVEPEEQESLLRDMSILARVRSAEARGMVIIEIDKALFESLVGDAARAQGVEFVVEWKNDDLGFSAPTVYRREKDLPPDANTG